MTPLTDAQVAALLDAQVIPTRDEDVQLFTTDRALDASARDAASVAGVIQTLALEVHQSRQRRCGDCQHWDRSGWLGEDTGSCLRGHHPCSPSDWSCADFLPKEPR